MKIKQLSKAKTKPRTKTRTVQLSTQIALSPAAQAAIMSYSVERVINITIECLSSASAQDHLTNEGAEYAYSNMREWVELKPIVRALWGAAREALVKEQFK